MNGKFEIAIILFSFGLIYASLVIGLNNYVHSLNIVINSQADEF